MEHTEDGVYHCSQVFHIAQLFAVAAHKMDEANRICEMAAPIAHSISVAHSAANPSEALKLLTKRLYDGNPLPDAMLLDLVLGMDCLDCNQLCTVVASFSLSEVVLLHDGFHGEIALGAD